MDSLSVPTANFWPQVTEKANCGSGIGRPARIIGPYKLMKVFALTSTGILLRAQKWSHVAGMVRLNCGIDF